MKEPVVQTISRRRADIPPLEENTFTEDNFTVWAWTSSNVFQKSNKKKPKHKTQNDKCAALPAALWGCMLGEVHANMLHVLFKMLPVQHVIMDRFATQNKRKPSGCRLEREKVFPTCGNQIVFLVAFSVTTDFWVKLVCDPLTVAFL